MSLFARELRHRLEAFIQREAARYGKNWFGRFALSTTLALLGVVALHVAILLALTQGTLIRVIVLGPILAGGLVLTSMVLWLYWRARLRPADVTPYAIAVLLGSITAGVALEAFSATQLVLWRSGAVSTAPGAGAPSLWSVEQLYGWHLLNSIPLLSVPRTLGIDRPDLFADHGSGALLLAFKVVVLVPLIALVVSGYRVAEQRLADAQAALLRRDTGARPRLGSWDDDIWPVALAVALAAAVAAIVVWGALDPGSPLRGLITDLLPREAEIEDVTVPLGWVDAWLLPIAGAWLVFLVLAKAGEQIDYYTPELPSAGGSGLGWAATVCFGLLFATVAIVGTTIVLIRTGVSHPSGSVGDADVLGVAMSFHFWHLLDGIPGLDIPQTLNWELRHDLHDEWSGLLLLIYKAILAFGLIFVTSRIVQPHLRSRSNTGPGALAAVADFNRLASAAERQVVDAERERMAGGLIWYEHRHLDSALRLLEEASTRVQSLFGPGAVVEQADHVVALVERREHGLASLHLRSRSDAQIEADHEAFSTALARFRAAARRALQQALRGAA